MSDGSARAASVLREKQNDGLSAQPSSDTHVSQTLKYVISEHNAMPMVRATRDSAGLDIRACESVVIPKNEQALINTGIKVQIPIGYVGNIVGRSSLALSELYTFNGTVDSDYRGCLKILIRNMSNKDVFVTIGDRIAQLVICKIIYPRLFQVTELDVTE